MRGRTDRLQGHVDLALPMRWQAIGYLLLASLVAAGALLALTSYARVEAVQGVVVLDKGIAAILASRPGIVSSIEVREGQRVRSGEPLARIRSEEEMLAGAAASDRIREALSEQDATLVAQRSSYRAATVADRGRLSALMRGLQAEITFLDEQIADQKRLVETASREFAEIQEVAKRGYISRRDVSIREAAVINRRQQLAQLEQSRSAKSAELAETGRAVAQTAASGEAQAASAQALRSGLARELAQAELAQGYTLAAPMAGIATGVSARPGQAVKSGEPLMMVVPDGATPLAELAVPTAASGFISPGQEVRIAIDAFPYQRFGTVAGRIQSIASAPTMRGSGEKAASVYIVTVRLDRPWIEAFGRRHPLVAGMTLSARIVMERRSLVEWLFEPVLAVRKR